MFVCWIDFKDHTWESYPQKFSPSGVRRLFIHQLRRVYLSCSKHCDRHWWHEDEVRSLVSGGQDRRANIPLQWWVSKVSTYRCKREGLLKCSQWGPIPRLSDSVGLGWGLRICISNKVQGDDDDSDAGPGTTTFWEIALKCPWKVVNSFEHILDVELNAHTWRKFILPSLKDK